MMWFLKYEFYNILLSNVIFFRVTQDVTWTQPMCVYIYIFGRGYATWATNSSASKKNKLNKRLVPSILGVLL